MNYRILVETTLSLMLGLSSSAHASSARELPCGILEEVRYTATQLGTDTLAIIKGYEENSQFVLHVRYEYKVGSRSSAVEKFGHSFVYQPFVFDISNGQTQDEYLFVDGIALHCH